MTQTTDGMSFAESDVYHSTDGSDWTEISGFATAVAYDGGENQMSETYTADGAGAIITAGKREPLEVTVRYVYTEGSADPFEIFRAAYENKTDLYFKWMPGGSVASNFEFTTAVGKVKSPPYPAGEVGPDAILGECTIVTGSITKAVVS